VARESSVKLIDDAIAGGKLIGVFTQGDPARDERAGREEPVSAPKPFDIPKQMVWGAYQRVKANKGAAGVDDQSIADFEVDLKGNLYKLWNRMASGSYLPPPVKAVELPKKDGSGTRTLGVPTVPA